VGISLRERDEETNRTDTEVDLDASPATEANRPPVGTHDIERVPEWPPERVDPAHGDGEDRGEADG